VSGIFSTGMHGLHLIERQVLDHSILNRNFFPGGFQQGEL
jgi:hypothetical protein